MWVPLVKNWRAWGRYVPVLIPWNITLRATNTVEPPGTSPFRWHFYSGDTSLEPEGVPWIEVSLYSVKQEQGGKSTVRRDPNFPVNCKQFLGIVARASFLRARERGKRAKRCSLENNVLTHAKTRGTAYSLAKPRIRSFGSSRNPLQRGEGTRDEPLRTSAWEANSHPTVTGIFSNFISVSSVTSEWRS